MLYSKSSQYAIRSMAYLAKLPADQLCGIELIARKEKIPYSFLAKIMQALVKKRLVRSARGLNGGFTLNAPPEKISLLMIVDAIENLTDEIQECILGKSACSDENRCALHDSWKDLRNRQLAFLGDVSLADLAAQIKQRK